MITILWRYAANIPQNGVVVRFGDYKRSQPSSCQAVCCCSPPFLFCVRQFTPNDAHSKLRYLTCLASMSTRKTPLLQCTHNKKKLKTATTIFHSVLMVYGRGLKLIRAWVQDSPTTKGQGPRRRRGGGGRAAIFFTTFWEKQYNGVLSCNAANPPSNTPERF